MNPQCILIGADGEIGQAVKRALEGDRCYQSLIALDWPAVCSAWPRVVRDQLLASPASDLVAAIGITNPREPAERIVAANLDLPKQIFAVAQASGRPFRLLTFGTIHENFPALCAANQYLESKRLLSAWMKEQYDRTKNTLHVRLHTVYGGTPKPHMFLGQIITALGDERTFEMSAGRQLREYHHVDDIAATLLALLKLPWDFGPIAEISSGQGVSLAALATAIFKALDRSQLLKIGAQTASQNENFSEQFKPLPDWLTVTTRDPIDGVVEFVRAKSGSADQGG